LLRGTSQHRNQRTDYRESSSLRRGGWRHLPLRVRTAPAHRVFLLRHSELGHGKRRHRLLDLRLLHRTEDGAHHPLRACVISAIGKSFRARGGRGCGCAPSSLWQSATPKRVKDVWDSIILLLLYSTLLH